MTTQQVTRETQNAGNPQPQKSDGTDYVILEQIGDAAHPPATDWAEFARETARSDSQAIRRALEGNTDGGTFVAIPARSFKPVKVTAETKTTLKLEEAR
jgi:hypothetical protein